MSATDTVDPRGLWQALRNAIPGMRWRGNPIAGRDRQQHTGRVHLIGCGPGDPELLTLKAARLIGEADALFYDRLVDPAVLALAPDHARRVFVGKQCGRHSTDQHSIHQRLIDEARRGRRVVRLKGGDPFIFGRGGEELRACREAGVVCSVIPGVTAALGCAAEAALPLTYRGIARAVTFATAHTATGPALDSTFAPLLTAGHTLAVYMGRRGLVDLARQLRAQGVPGDVPVALVLDGTTTRQRTLRGTLEALPHCDSVPVDAAGLVLLGRALAAAEVTAKAEAMAI